MEESENKPKALNSLDRKIFLFYEWGLKYVPIFLMLCHWYGVWNFHQNPREIIVNIDENEGCIIYLYFMSYIFPLLFMVPASLFYGLCWIYRLPFVYLIGTSMIRLYFGSLLIKNEMIDADYILILFMIALYIYSFIRINGGRIGSLFLRIKNIVRNKK